MYLYIITQFSMLLVLLREKNETFQDMLATIACSERHSMAQHSTAYSSDFINGQPAESALHRHTLAKENQTDNGSTSILFRTMSWRVAL